MQKVEFEVVGSVVNVPHGTHRHDALAAAVATVLESDNIKTRCLLFNGDAYLIRFEDGELTVRTLRG